MKKVLALVVCMCLLVALLAGCAGKKEQSSIKIGVITSLTGERAQTGVYTKNAGLIAVDEINKAGGVLGKKLELVFEDDSGTDAGSVNAFNKLTSTGDIVAVVGSLYSTMDIAISPLVQKAKVPTLVMGSSMAISKLNNQFMFQNRADDLMASELFAKAIVETLKLKNPAVIHESDSFGQGLANAIEENLAKLGVTVKTDIVYNKGEKDFTPMLSKIKDAKADGIIGVSQQLEAGLIMKQVKSFGLNVPFLGSTSYCSQIAIDLAKDAAEGVYAIGDFAPTIPLQKGQELVKNYRAKYNADPDLPSALTYDSIYNIVTAIKNAKSTEGEALKNAIASLKNIEGSASIYTFDERRVGGKTGLLVQNKAGIPTVIKMIKKD